MADETETEEGKVKLAAFRSGNNSLSGPKHPLAVVAFAQVSVVAASARAAATRARHTFRPLDRLLGRVQ